MKRIGHILSPRADVYEFKSICFGLTNAPVTFKRMVDEVLVGLKWNTFLVYLDDSIILAPTMSHHLALLVSVLQRIERAWLKFKLSKCSFLEQSLKVPGFLLLLAKASTDPAKISAMPDFPIPLNVKEVQSFLVIFSYYLRFVPEFAILVRPISNVTKMSQLFSCGNERQRSFEALKTLKTKS